MFNTGLTEEEKKILCEDKYFGMDLEEIDERIELHNQESDKLLKRLKSRYERKKYYCSTGK